VTSKFLALASAAMLAVQKPLVRNGEAPSAGATKKSRFVDLLLSYRRLTGTFLYLEEMILRKSLDWKMGCKQ
jgi:hypothetical protein